MCIITLFLIGVLVSAWKAPAWVRDFGFGAVPFPVRGSLQKGEAYIIILIYYILYVIFNTHVLYFELILHTIIVYKLHSLRVLLLGRILPLIKS